MAGGIYRYARQKKIEYRKKQVSYCKHCYGTKLPQGSKDLSLGLEQQQKHDIAIWPLVGHSKAIG